MLESLSWFIEQRFLLNSSIVLFAAAFCYWYKLVWEANLQDKVALSPMWTWWFYIRPLPLFWGLKSRLDWTPLTVAEPVKISNNSGRVLYCLYWKLLGQTNIVFDCWSICWFCISRGYRNWWSLFDDNLGCSISNEFTVLFGLPIFNKLFWGVILNFDNLFRLSCFISYYCLFGESMAEISWLEFKYYIKDCLWLFPIVVAAAVESWRLLKSRGNVFLRCNSWCLFWHWNYYYC